jgi:hypothetical protein
MGCEKKNYVWQKFKRIPIVLKGFGKINFRY